MERTVDSIIKNLTRIVSNNEPISPEDWLKSAQYLNTLSLDEMLKLVDLESKVAQIERQFIDSGCTNADAKSRVKATEEWKAFKNQEARIKFIREHILIAKKWSGVISGMGA